MTLSTPDQKLIDEVKRMHRSQEGNLALLQKYLDEGAEPNAMSENGESVLEVLLNPNVNMSHYKRWQALSLLIERGAKIVAHGKQVIALFEENTSAEHAILPAMVKRQKIGANCVDKNGNNPLHWMLSSPFAMIGTNSFLEDKVEGRAGFVNPKLHDDWLHGVNLEGNTPMMTLWLCMLEHAKNHPDTEYKCGVALNITSSLMALGGDVRLLNNAGECALDLITQYQNEHFASELPAEGALLSEINAWKMGKQVNACSISAPTYRL